MRNMFSKHVDFKEEAKIESSIPRNNSGIMKETSSIATSTNEDCLENASIDSR